MRADDAILPDVLAPGLRVVFCGMAAGTVSAARGAYYAGPGNRFWPVLAAIGLTPAVLPPAQFRAVLGFGIGLTDMVKTASGSDADLPRGASDIPGFTARIRAVRPAWVAFNGKRAAATFYGVPTARFGYGPGPDVADFPPIMVLPSTSGAASGAWRVEPWQDLARLVAGRAT